MPDVRNWRSGEDVLWQGKTESFWLQLRLRDLNFQNIFSVRPDGRRAGSGRMDRIVLPPDFEQAALKQFKKLRDRGKLFYFSTDSEIIDGATGFKVSSSTPLYLRSTADQPQLQFVTSSAIIKKPILARDAPERSGHGGPFINPDPDFVVAELGLHHILEFSMHCVYRPHFVLHTRHFAPQTDDLDLGDFEAAWAVMTAGSSPQMMIYNCGYDAGASQGHKHLQVFAVPRPFALFPDEAQSTEEILSSVPNVPFRHFVLRLPRDTNTREILLVYQKLLAEVRKFQGAHGGGPAYNVMMTEEWMCLVPRRHGGKGAIGTNATGMLGVVWVGNRAEREQWTALGLEKHLVYMGYPQAESPHAVSVHACQLVNTEQNRPACQGIST